MPTPPNSCEECHRRKQKCNRETPCQNCIARGKEDVCRPHKAPIRPKDALEKRLAAVEEELRLYRSNFDDLRRQGVSPFDVSSSNNGKGISRNDEDESDNDSDSHISEGQVSTSLEVPPVPETIGEEMEKRQVGSVLEELKKTRLVDIRHSPQLQDPPLFNKEQLSEVALQNHGVPKSFFTDLVSVLPPRHICDALVSHFYTHINWIRQPWPRRSLCQSFDAFWSSGPTVTTQSINIFALLCGLCAIARLSIEGVNFDSDFKARKLQARQLHFTSRHALMLSSVFNREDLDQIIAWTLVSRFLVLERRYGEAYTCAARTVKAAYMIDLHRDGTKQGFNKDITEARRKVWSAVYYFDRTISMLTGRPPVVDDRFCDVLAPSETGLLSDIYPLPAHPPRHLLKEGENLPTVYAYCVHRHCIAKLQGQMVVSFLHIQDGPSSRRKSRDKELFSINKDLQSIKKKLPTYLRVHLDDQGGIVCDKSLDKYYGYLPIQRFLLQSEVNALCIGLHRPFLLSTKEKDANSLHTCLDAALLDIALYKDFMNNCGSSTHLELQVYIGSHRWFHSVILCGIVLLAHPGLGEEKKLFELLTDFVDLSKRPLHSSSLDTSSIRETEIINIFIQGYQNRQQANANSQGSSNHKRKSRDDVEKKQARLKKSKVATSSSRPPLLQKDHETGEESRNESTSSFFSDPADSFTADQYSSSESNTPAQHLLSTWYSRGSNPPLSASNSNESIDISQYSHVFGDSEISHQQSGSIPFSDQADAGGSSSISTSDQANDWFSNVPIIGYDDNSPWSQHPPAPTPLQNHLTETSTSANDNTIDVDFWLDLIKQL